MGRLWGVWQSLNFDKEYLFGFETLVFVTSGILSMHTGILSMHNQLVILEIAPSDPFKAGI